MKQKNKNLILSTIIALSLIGCSSINGRPKNAPALQTAPNIETSKYLGKWFEIARYPNSFEKNCINVTAEYSLNSNGTIGVLNTCYDKNNPTKKRSAKAYAQKVGDNNAILAVNFAPFPLPKGDGNYHILWVDDDYSKAIVGEPKGKYLWFLARSSKISDQDYEKMMQITKNQSYDLAFLEKVQQDN